jgi:hypothetical protein
LQRPQSVEPIEFLRPGLHRPAIGNHSVVWFDPSILELQVEEGDEGLEDGLLRPTTNEPALDDVLVHCDRLRKLALLNVIYTISRTRQVILFTQEEEVLQWAQQSIVSPDQLLMLSTAS